MTPPASGTGRAVRLAQRIAIALGVAASLLLVPGPQGPQASTERSLKDYEIGNYSFGGGFTLTNQDGKPTRLSDFKGKAVLLFFGYTHCPDVCPMTLAEFEKVKRALGSEASQLAVIFISLDPARDTPAVLKAFVGNFDAHFYGLTGDRATVDAVAGKYNASYRIRKVAGSSDYYVDHTAFAYLIGPDGKVRYLFPFDVRAELVVQGVREVLKNRS
jgi:protein SCO1/2